MIKQEKEKHHINIEDAEVNIMYTTAFALYIIANDAEKRMLSDNMKLKYRSKQLFNGIINDLKCAKKKHDELYQDYVTAWKGNIKNYDEEQENAYSLARLLMLWFDRIAGFDDKEKQVEEFIRQISEKDVVTEESLKRFYVIK